MATKIKTMRLRADIVDKVQEMATKENRSFTNMVETLLVQEVGMRKFSRWPKQH